MIRYAITDLARLQGGEIALWQLASRWSADGVDFVQLREKDLDSGALTALARKMVTALAPRTKLLVNGRADVAIAAGAAGVHLTEKPGELTPQQVRRVFTLAGKPEPVVSVSCHSIEAAIRARDDGATMILFAPVYEKVVGGVSRAEGAGLEMLQRVCEIAAPVRVLALGGVTWASAKECMDAGAAGVAGIRLFS